jgi:GTP-binding protein Era
MGHRSGFCAIIGKPNAGKSTLMNQFLGTSLSAVTPKAQTTRHRIKGILSGEDFQIVFSDTPGLLTPAYLLHEKMAAAILSACQDADVVLLLVDCTEPADAKVVDFAQKIKVPLVIALNKADLSTQQALESRCEEYHKIFPQAEIIPVSALYQFNLNTLLKVLLRYLPESPPYYDREELSDRNERFFAEEIIREQLFLHYEKEIPYSSEVVVTDWKESQSLVRIAAVIFVLRESQKAIVLGHQGRAIKKMATEARKKLEQLIGKKVFLEVTIKVNPRWRTDEKMLKRLGYPSA